jgi:flagellar biosynthesis/type III secretory pathway chaperone
MDEQTTTVDWDGEITGLLDQLGEVQDELLTTLIAKRDVMAAGDLEGLAPLQAREVELGERLEACHQRRTALLARASSEGLPGESVSELAAALPAGRQNALPQQVRQVAERTRLLRHHSLTNWVLAQRSLLHLSQLLEILATGGQIRPTYSKEETPHSRGALVDHAA